VEINKEVKQEQIEIYMQIVEDFYQSVQKWIEKKDYICTKESMNLDEEKTGSYTINKMLIKKQDKTIAEILPIGLDIIGANGRIDLVTPYETRKFLYFKKGGPVITTKVEGKKIDHKVFTGIESDDWYWIESVTLKKAYKVDREVFLSLLDEVTSKWVI